MDTGLESRIDVLNAVRGKEEDAFVVFEYSKEDYVISMILRSSGCILTRDKLVPFEVMSTALLKEHIRFIK